MFEIRKYTPDQKEEWNKFVNKSKNATFLFDRNYMDYHSDRFDDFSLMFYKNNKLYALLPAHKIEDTLYSHFGLTYGGLIMDIHANITGVCILFTELNEYLRTIGFKKVIYRPIPWIYCKHASEEDLYAIFWKCHAHLLTRNIGTTIFMNEHMKWRKDHIRRLRKAILNGVQVVADASLDDFWNILNDNLKQRFNAKPVHTLEEMKLLKSRFPNNIIQYNAYKDGNIIGGITFYMMRNVIHGQYSSTNSIGKDLGAMEAIYDKVMYHDYPDYQYLDFGSSTEDNCSVINKGLISHKEGYGGRGVVYDTYEWEL